MTAEQIATLGPAFTVFTHSLSGCFPRFETRRHLATYGRGLLSDLPRKSVEPIALTAGTAVRTLQEFLTHHDASTRIPGGDGSANAGCICTEVGRLGRMGRLRKSR